MILVIGQIGIILAIAIQVWGLFFPYFPKDIWNMSRKEKIISHIQKYGSIYGIVTTIICAIIMKVV